MQGTTSDFGNINKNLWHSTVIGGTIKLITLCPYVSFEPGGLLGVADNPCKCAAAGSAGLRFAIPSKHAGWI